MLKITDAVREILLSSQTAFSAAQGGFLNLSAYAKSIRREVEGRTKKPVQPGSITVALSRLQPSIQKMPPLLPQVEIKSISVRSGLIEVAYDNTEEHRGYLSALYKNASFTDANFATITQGLSEISIVVPRELRAGVLRIFRGRKPKLLLEHLASLTVSMDGKHIIVPNTFYALMQHLAVKRINIAEAVSTYTELTFLLDQEDTGEAFRIFNNVFKQCSNEATSSREK